MQPLILLLTLRGDFMKIDSKTIFLLGVLGLGIYLYSQFTHKNNSGQSQGIILSALAKPKSNLPSCYPTEIDSPPLEQYSIVKKGERYTYFIAPQLNDKSQTQSVEAILIKENIDGLCQVLSKRDKFVSLLAYLPQDIAVNLVRQGFKKKISKIGLKSFQTRLNNVQADEDPNPTFYFPEEIIALKDLGIMIPKKTLIVNQACEAQFLNPYIQKQMKRDKSYADKLKASCPSFKKFNE